MQRRRQTFKFSDQNDGWMQQNGSRAGECSVRGKYQQHYKNYLNFEFTYTCYEFVQRICNEAKKVTQLQGLPLRQVLANIAKMLFLNELEFLFLTCLLNELQWPIFDDSISNHAAAFKVTPATDDLRIKCLHLYLLLACYSVKVYLNENVKIFEGQMLEILPNFTQVFRSWADKYAKDALRFNPLMLNSMYMQYTDKPRKYKQSQYQDLNNKVAILVQNMPIPDGDSGYIKEQYIPQQPESIWPIVVNNENNIEIELKMIEEIPALVSWPFRSDSVGSVNGHHKSLLSLEHWNNMDNIPFPTLSKRFSAQSDGFHQ